MGSSQMVERMLARCPCCGSDWAPEREIRVNDPAKTFRHECSDCGHISRLRVDAAIARRYAADEDNYRRRMCC